MLQLKEIVNNKTTTYAEYKAELEKQARTGTGNFTTLVNNGTTDVETIAKNKIKTFETKTKIIIPDEVVTYTVKLDGDYEDTLDKDLGMVKFCFWLQDKDKKDVKLELGVGKAVKTQKASRNAIQIVKKGNKASTGYQSDFLEIKAGENFTKNVADHSYYYAIITVDKEKKEVKLQVKFSKWMDTYKIRVESYLLGDPIKGDGAATTLSRTVQANPELVESYWLNAEGKKILQTGFVQDVYLYLKTLGLNNKELEVNVYDKDYYPTPLEPAIFYGSTPQDDLIVWENNTIKIEDRNTIKQFKVGDKVRYENAAVDEDGEYKTWYDTAISQDNFFTIIDPTEKNDDDLELYIHFPDWKTLKLPEDNAYANLKLTTKALISNAFFAEIEKEEVQADAPEIKDKKTGDTKLPPKAKVNYYKKIDNGVLGQKVNLVAACANLEGKKVIFKIYEKEPLLTTLVDADAALPVLQDDKEVTKIEATVKNGYAVAVIELKHKKNQEDNKDWLDKLKNGYYDTKGKTAHLFITVICNGEIQHKVEFLKDSYYKMIGNNWHEPIKNPQRNKYNYYGDEKPKSSAFGKVRSDETKYHQGLDIFAVPGTPIYACLDGIIVEKRYSSSVGNVITIEINEKNEIVNRKIESNYSFEYPSTGSKGEKEKGASFDLNDKSKIYIRHYHLSKVNVEVGNMVKAGTTIIGESGVTGNAHLTRAPHLHLEILDTVDYTYELKDKINPAYFVDLKTIDNSIQDESVKYKYNKNGTKKKV